MKPVKKKILVGVLTLATSPLGLLGQGAPEQGAPAGPGPQGRPEMRRDRDDRRWKNQRRHRRGKMRHPRRQRGRGVAMILRNPTLRERAGISAEQAAKIQGQQAAFAKSRVRDRADLRVKQIDLRQLMAAEKPDRAAIDKKLREISEVRLAAQQLAVQHWLAMREAITPGQKEKMKQLFRERMRDGREGRPPAA